jgi:hypothetical protein
LLVESRPYLGYDLCATQKLWIEPDKKPGTSLTKRLFEGKRVLTPLEVKRALDDALLEHNVSFLTGTFPAELLVTGDGAPGGLTIVGRSGRQAVRAKVIIDATPDAMLTRQSAAQFEPFNPGPKECRFTVIGGDLRTEAEGVSGRRVPGMLYPSHTGPKKSYPVFEYTFHLEHESDTFRARSRALNLARSMVCHPDMVDHSEHLLHIPDTPIIPAAAPKNHSPDLGPFRPSGIENLYVLSAYAALDEPSRRLHSPCTFARIGQRIGADAAGRAENRPTPASLNHAAAATASRDTSTAEVPPSFRFRHCPRLELAGHDLPVLGRWDVVVIGGGTSGAPAALGAARSGARTLVIEYLDELGGVGTAGLISKYWYGHRTGFTAEINKALGVKDDWWPMQKSEWLRAELLKNGAEVWFGSFGCGAVMKGSKVAGAVVATPFGRGVPTSPPRQGRTPGSAFPRSATSRSR